MYITTDILYSLRYAMVALLFRGIAPEHIHGVAAVVVTVQREGLPNCGTREYYTADRSEVRIYRGTMRPPFGSGPLTFCSSRSCNTLGKVPIGYGSSRLGFCFLLLFVADKERGGRPPHHYFRIPPIIPGLPHRSALSYTILADTRTHPWHQFLLVHLTTNHSLVV